MDWDLSVLYPSCEDPCFVRELEQLREALGQATAEIEAGALDADALERHVRRLEELKGCMQSVSNMVNLTLAAEAGDPAALKASEGTLAARQAYALLESRLARRLCAVADLQGLIEGHPFLCRHAYFLKRLARAGSHQIDGACERQVLTMQLTGGLAFARLRGELMGSACGVLHWQRRQRRLNMTAIERMLGDEDRQLRRAAWRARQAICAQLEAPMAACLSGIKGEGIALSEWKNYESALDWSLDINRIDRDVLKTLEAAIWESAPLFRRYMAAKARALGHQGGLPDWDFRAPLGTGGVRVSFEQAGELLREALGGFDPRMGAFIQRAFEERWIDWSVRDRKGGDCFNTNLYRQGQSRIMVSFDGGLDGVFTLAHELGHAYHDECLRESGILNSDYPMTIAETASIFCETLLFAAMGRSCAPRARLALLDRQLYCATRQTLNMMARLRFEQRVFEERSRRVLTPQWVKAAMLDAQRQAYGESAGELNPYLWMIGDHLFLPELHFYNYPYAFGRLLSSGLYAAYRDEGAPFAQKYRYFLSRTGAMGVAEAARIVGVDIYDKDFWRGALTSFTPLVEEFERLARPASCPP